MEITISSTKELEKLASKLAKKTFTGDVFALYGELGSGKTTFVRFFVEALGFEARVQSPTFVIVRIYKKDTNDNYAKDTTGISKIYHVDLYRLGSKEDAVDIGIKEMFTEDGVITLIEWPELIESELPQDVIKIRFEYCYDSENEDQRKVFI